jgi:tetratricopeptide (TPR) repeat protein
MVWRLWGRSGAIASAAFYIIEYAPANLGWRLEVNHPLWALGWWGGAEIVASWSERLVRGRADLRTLLFPILAVAAAPLAILLGGTATFMVRDPFVGELRHFVAEGMSLPAVVGLFGFGTVSYDVISALVLVPAAVVLARRRDESRLVVGLLTIVTIGFVLMSCAEMRWWLNTAGAQIALVLGLVALAKRRAWTITISGALVLFVAPAVQRVARDFAENKRQAVSERDLMQPLYRDIAATLRESQPQGDLVLLADPNASAGIGYFGRFKTLGTLYWENAPGLRAAANIVCARMDDEAAKLIRARGVTHVAVISTSNFIGEYFRLLNPTADRAGMENTFAVRLTREPPAWLQPVPYRIPAELKSDAQFVLLFKVAFEQTDLDRLYATAIARAAAGNSAAAEQALAEALARAPVDARFALCESAASAFYDYGADAAAVAVFRRALALRNDPAIATTLAWILATTSDAPLRDGRAALALVEARARANADDPTLLSAFAAACAEVGRFPDAIAAAQRALALVRSTGDEPAAKLLQDRLAAYQAGRAWRQ